jgi:hypothetical protein
LLRLNCLSSTTNNSHLLKTGNLLIKRELRGVQCPKVGGFPQSGLEFRLPLPSHCYGLAKVARNFHILLTDSDLGLVTNHDTPPVSACQAFF